MKQIEERHPIYMKVKDAVVLGVSFAVGTFLGKIMINGLVISIKMLMGGR